MKKRFIVLFSAIAMLLGACGNSVEHTTGMMKVDGGELILGEYEGLTVDKVTYEVTDEDVDSEIDNLLEDYVEYKKVDRKARSGDYVAFDLKSTSNGQEIADYTGEGYGAHIGRGDFDDEFEENLIGTASGDKKKFTITYAEDYPEEVLAGNTVDYELTINQIEELIYPELTDEFVQKNLDYKTEEELRKGTREKLEDAAAEDAEYSMQSELQQQIIDSSTFEKYSDKLYDTCKEAVEAEYLSYAEMLGCETVDEVYESLGMKEEDVEKEVLSQVYTRMIIDAIAQKEKLEVSDEEYKEKLAQYVNDMEYEDEESLLADYSEDELRFSILQDKVITFVADHAQITEIETEESQE